MPRYEKGDILLADFGEPPREVVGHEQGYVRPCIVLACFDETDLVLCASCTSSPGAKRFGTALLLKASKGGLNADGFVQLHQIRSISFDRVIRRLGSLPSEAMEDISEMLAGILGI